MVAPAPVVSAHAAVVRDLWSHECQVRPLQPDGTGPRVLPHQRLAPLARGIRDSADTPPLARVLSEAPWRAAAVNRRRRRFTRPRQHNARTRMHTPGAPVWLVEPACRARQAQVRTTMARAIALVDAAIRCHGRVGVGVFDAWSLAEDVVRGVARRHKAWVSRRTTNRRLETASWPRRDVNGWARSGSWDALKPSRGREARSCRSRPASTGAPPRASAGLGTGGRRQRVRRTVRGRWASASPAFPLVAPTSTISPSNASATNPRALQCLTCCSKRVRRCNTVSSVGSLTAFSPPYSLQVGPASSIVLPVKTSGPGTEYTVADTNGGQPCTDGNGRPKPRP
jgi:hypothetical protein